MPDRMHIVKAMEANASLFLTYFAKWVPHMELYEQPDFTLVRSTIADNTFNFAVNMKFTKEKVSSKVQEVISFFHSKKLPFSWYLGPFDTPENLGEILKANGSKLTEENPGMYLNLEDYSFTSQNLLDIKRALNSETLRHFDYVNKKVGESPHFDTIFHYLPQSSYGEKSPIEIYVGYVKELPVSTGILFFHEGVVGIYFVSTVPEEQRKGFGKAMMFYLLNRAKESGSPFAVLQATAEGLPLYQNLGFVECCQFAEYDMDYIGHK